MRFKRLLALLLAAALALAVLVGCGSGQQSAAQALLKLLDGKYPNISIEIDPELEADLRQAISQAEAENAGDDAAAIRAALEKLVGSTVTFRYLGEGQQGDTTFDLVFYAGTDPDKAAQAAYSQWNVTFSNVPDDGKYGTGLAMVETENGIWMLVKATVEKAGTVDKPDKDDDEPETQEPPEQEKGYTEVTDSNGNVTGYTVNTEDGLQNLFTGGNPDEALRNARENDFADITITLKAGTSYTVDATGPLADTFNGTLQGENGAKIILSDTTRTQGLFNTIGTNGKVLNVDIEVSGTINVNTIGSRDVANVGAVAGTNNGTIQNCDVTGSTGSTIQGDNYNDNVGGIVGCNYGTIKSCSSAAAVKNGKNTGGIAGSNSVNSGKSGTITNCCSTGTVTSDINNSNTGGVVGDNNGATITACYSTGNITSNGEYSSYAGGVAGANMLKPGSGNGQIIACYSTGKVSGTTAGGVVGWNSTSSAVIACYHADGEVSRSIEGGTAGGVVGQNGSEASPGQITACYWSGIVEGGKGIGYPESDDNATKITGEGKEWDALVKAMKDKGYNLEGTWQNPTGLTPIT